MKVVFLMQKRVADNMVVFNPQSLWDLWWAAISVWEGCLWDFMFDMMPFEQATW